MSSFIRVRTTYHSGNDFGGGLEVSKFSVKKRGLKTSQDNKWKMSVDFEGEQGSVEKAWIIIDPELAIPLARALLSVAEGYVSESVSEVA